MLGPHNEPSSWGPGALSEEILRGPTLIKVKSWKSDFNQREPAGNFSAAFLCNRCSGNRDVNGPNPPEGGLSAGAGIRGFHGQPAHIMSEQFWQEGPLEDGFTQEVKS